MTLREKRKQKPTPSEVEFVSLYFRVYDSLEEEKTARFHSNRLKWNSFSRFDDSLEEEKTKTRHRRIHPVDHLFQFNDSEKEDYKAQGSRSPLGQKPETNP